MRLETIHDLWELDSQINMLDLSESAGLTPKLHAKYWKILTSERMVHKIMEAELSSLRHAKFLFFIQGPDEVSQSKGWELPARGKIMVKEEAWRYVDDDNEVVEKTLKLSVQKEKLLLVEGIIHNINSRSYTIRNIIDYMKFKAGN